jgi:hypothetical protein
MTKGIYLGILRVMLLCGVLWCTACSTNSDASDSGETLEGTQVTSLDQLVGTWVGGSGSGSGGRSN